MKSLRLVVVLLVLGLLIAPVSPSEAPSAVAETANVPGQGTYLDDPPYPGFNSPYLGHTGFRNIPLAFDQEDYPLLDAERDMGLKWSFASVLWAGFEPAGPTSAENDPSGAWAKMDRWVIACRERGLNLLVQPVLSGNGGAPPPWAGYRTPLGYSEEHTWEGPDGQTGSYGAFAFPGPPRAPQNIDALIDWFVKLVDRYKPGGALAQEQGWTDGYGVGAWEIENEPDAYDFWFAELDDLAEIYTKAYPAMKAADPKAVIVGPAAGVNAYQAPGLLAMLDRRMQRASLEYKLNYDATGVQYALGPNLDVISLHSYERLDAESAETTIALHKPWWDLYSTQPGFEYPTNRQFWHTEGGLDYGSQGDNDIHFRARWIPSYLARGFGAGITRLTLMDLYATGDDTGKANARQAVRTFIDLLPNPHPVTRLSTDADAAQIYRSGSDVWTYIAWATSASTTASIPVRTATARLIDKYGETETILTAVDGAVSIELAQMPEFNEPWFVVEVPESTTVLDTTAPDAPVISSPGEGARTKSPVVLAGTAEPGSTVSVYEAGAVIASTTASDSGAWSITKTFAGGSHSVHATATDLAGNVSTPSAARTFRISGRK